LSSFQNDIIWDAATKDLEINLQQDGRAEIFQILGFVVAVTKDAQGHTRDMEIRRTDDVDKIMAELGGNVNFFMNSTNIASEVTAAGVFNVISGGSNRDQITGSRRGVNIMVGGGGNDVLRALGPFNVQIGGDGDDRIIGSRGIDHQFGMAGNDVLESNGGCDIQNGGEGVDTINGKKETPTMYGGSFPGVRSRSSSKTSESTSVSRPSSTTELPSLIYGIQEGRSTSGSLETIAFSGAVPSRPGYRIKYISHNTPDSVVRIDSVNGKPVTLNPGQRFEISGNGIQEKSLTWRASTLVPTGNPSLALNLKIEWERL